MNWNFSETSVCVIRDKNVRKSADVYKRLLCCVHVYRQSYAVSYASLLRCLWIRRWTNAVVFSSVRCSLVTNMIYVSELGHY